MGVDVVVHYLGQFLAGDVHEVGQIVVAGSDDDLARAVTMFTAELIARGDRQSSGPRR